MWEKKAVIRGKAAKRKRAIAATEEKAIVQSPIPINICSLREAQILAVKLASGALVKVCSVAAKDANALILLLERQTVHSGWIVAPEDMRALTSLGTAYLLGSTAIDAHHTIVAANIASAENRGYLVAFKEWSLDFEDAAAHVPSVGAFEFSKEARTVSKLALKVVMGGHNGRRSLDWLGARLDQIGQGLVTLMNSNINFPCNTPGVNYR